MDIEHKIKHLAIIMDGNRRWATERGMPKMLGHTEGAKNLKRIAKAVKARQIPYLTVWALSTENLRNRTDKELEHLFTLFGKLTDYLDDFFADDVRCNIIGDLTELPVNVKENLENVVEKTKDNSAMTLTLAINYGGRDELLRAMQQAGNKNASEESFAKHLDTHGLPDPDLIIRTGRHQRLSGFLPWQSVYAELYFTDAYWPAFDEEELDKALAWYDEQQQNFGS